MPICIKKRTKYVGLLLDSFENPDFPNSQQFKLFFIIKKQHFSIPPKLYNIYIYHLNAFKKKTITNIQDEILRGIGKMNQLLFKRVNKFKKYRSKGDP
jgi:hypothetical protein